MIRKSCKNCIWNNNITGRWALCNYCKYSPMAELNDYWEGKKE